MVKEIDMTVQHEHDWRDREHNGEAAYICRICGETNKEKTTIILSQKNIQRIAELGRKGETYDDIINKLVYYDIKLNGEPSHTDADMQEEQDNFEPARYGLSVIDFIEEYVEDPRRRAKMIKELIVGYLIEK